MNGTVYFEMGDKSQVWYDDVISNHYEEAVSKVAALLGNAEEDENGCLVTNTVLPRKLRFHGVQDRAYRFIYCVNERHPAASDEVIRHQCHNRRCINPAHLTIGSRAENKHDDWDFAANGVDFRFL